MYAVQDQCNPMDPLHGALPVPYVPMRITHGAVIAHRYTYAASRCRTSQCRMTFIRLSVSLCIDLGDSVFDGVGLAGFKSRANAFSLSPTVFHFSSFILWVGIVGLGFRTDRC